MFRRLVCLGSLPAFWRQTNVSPIPKAILSSFYQLPTDFYNITVVEAVTASGVGSSQTIYGTQWCAFDHQVCLSSRSGYLWSTFKCVPYTATCIGERAEDYRIVQIDFSAAFGRVNHQGILYKLCSVGIGGPLLSILTQFLSNRSHRVTVGGSRSTLVKRCVRSAAVQCFGDVIVPPVQLGVFSILEN